MDSRDGLEAGQRAVEHVRLIPLRPLPNEAFYALARLRPGRSNGDEETWPRPRRVGWRRAAGRLFVLALAAACGGPPQSVSGVATDRPAAETAPAAGSQGNHDQAHRTGGRSGEGPAQRDRAGLNESQPDAIPPWRPLPIGATLTPNCGTFGTAMKARIRTAPSAHLSIMVTYADGKSHGQSVFVQANSKGRFQYAWAIPATAPIGEARLSVAGADLDMRSGAQSWKFRVAPVGEC